MTILGINTLAHEFALETTSIFTETYTGDIQSRTKKISQTKVYVGQIKENQKPDILLQFLAY